MSPDQIRLMIQVIDNLDIFVSDDDTYEMHEIEMPKLGYPNFEQDVTQLRSDLEAMLP